MTKLATVESSDFKRIVDLFHGPDYNEELLNSFLSEAAENKAELANRLNLDKNGRRIIDVSVQKDRGTIKTNMESFINGCGYTLNQAIRNNFSLEDTIDNALSEEVTVVTSSGDPLHFNKGMKFSKALSRIMERMKYSHSKRDEVLTRYSQVLNEKTLSGKLVISVNPVDYYTMSVGENWGSCLSPGNEYSTGAFAYAKDKRSILTFLISSNSVVEDVPMKKWRRLLVLDESQEGVINIGASKGYPFDAPELTDVLLEDIWKTLNIESPMIRHDLKDVYRFIGNKSAMNSYSDFGLRNTCYIYSNLSREQYEGKLSINLSTGSHVDCLVCGMNEAAPEDGLCGPCIGYELCDDCGEIAYEGFSTAYDTCICEGCFDSNYVVPYDSSDAYHFDDVYWVESLGDYVTESYYEDNCAECDHCDKTILTEDSHDLANETLCDHCFQKEKENYVDCEDCGEEVHINDAIYVDETDEAFCFDCATTKKEIKVEES